MKNIVWDKPSEREYINGIDHAIFGVGEYIRDEGDDYLYLDALPWNGLVSVEHNHTGGEILPRYMYGQVVAHTRSPIVYTPNISTFTVPQEVRYCLGEDTFSDDQGVFFDTPYPMNNGAPYFCLSYRNYIGDANSSNKDYELHFMYGLTGVSDSRIDQTRTDSSEIEPISIDCVGRSDNTISKPASHITIRRSKVPDLELMDSLENFLYVNGQFPSAYRLLSLLGYV